MEESDGTRCYVIVLCDMPANMKNSKENPESGECLVSHLPSYVVQQVIKWTHDGLRDEIDKNHKRKSLKRSLAKINQPEKKIH